MGATTYAGRSTDEFLCDQQRVIATASVTDASAGQAVCYLRVDGAPDLACRLRAALRHWNVCAHPDMSFERDVVAQLRQWREREDLVFEMATDEISDQDMNEAAPQVALQHHGTGA